MAEAVWPHNGREREGLSVEAMVTEAEGRTESNAALLLAQHRQKQRPGGRTTLGADKAYDQTDLVETLRGTDFTPHMAQNNR